MTDQDRQTLDEFMRGIPQGNAAHDVDDHDRDHDRPPIRTTREAIAQLCLDEALSRCDRARMLRRGPLAVLAVVPSADWIEPIAAEIQCRTTFDRVAQSTKRKTGSTFEADAIRACVDCLTGGGRVLTVTNAPASLPPSLAASADLTITIRAPSDKALRRLIRWVTGQPVRFMPAGAATGLDLDVLCCTIREGSSATDCVKRLKAATRAVTVVDTSLADVPHVRDLHGYGVAGTWARKLVADIDAWRANGSDPETFARLDRNIVLGGPPGTGKTTLARAIARSAGLPLIASSVSSLFASSTGYLDGVIKAFDDVVGRAVAANGVLLLDELDALPNRATMSERDRAWWSTVVTHVLTTLDGAVSGAMGRVIVIGCTNHLDRLDTALIRPGRLRPIMVGLPRQADLAGIFRQHLGRDLPGADLTVVARLAIGASGAMVADWVARARQVATDAGRPMAMADLLAMVAPADTRSDEALKVAAFHEAAHCVATTVLGTGQVRSVSIVGDGMSGGRTDWFDMTGPTPTRDDIESMVVTGLCGRAADELFGSANAGAGGAHESDLGVATRMVASIHGSLGLGDRLVMRAPSADIMEVLKYDLALTKVVDEHLQQLMGRAREFVARHRDLIATVAHRLIEERVIDGPELRRLIVTASAGATRRVGGRHAQH